MEFNLKNIINWFRAISWQMSGVVALFVPFISYFEKNWAEAAFISRIYIVESAIIYLSCIVFVATMSAGIRSIFQLSFMSAFNSIAISLIVLFFFEEFRSYFINYGAEYDTEFVFGFGVIYILVIFLISALCSFRKSRDAVVFFSWFIFVVSASGAIYEVAYEKILQPGQIVQANSQLPVLSKSEIDQLNRSNVYFVVTDGYAGGNFMRDNLGFDNSPFVQEMEEAGFLVQPNALAPYNLTFLSLAAMLNMDYVLTADSARYRGRNQFYPSMMTRLQAPLAVREFADLGYEFWVFGNQWGRCAPKHVNCYDSVDDPVISYEIRGLIEATPFPWFEKKYKELFPKPVKMHDTIADFMTFLRQSTPSTDPSFYFVHHLPPHPPYFFSPDCERKPGVEIKFEAWGEAAKSEYLQNLQCTNVRLKALVSWITENDRDAMVVVTGDHGSAFSGIDHKEERLRTLTMSRFPLRCTFDGQRASNSVNMMRMVLSCARGEDPVLLPNKSYIGFYRGPNAGLVQSAD